MTRENYRNSPSSLTIAYQALYKRQEKLRRYLTYDEAKREIQSTPGIIFSPGTTFQDTLTKLKRLELIAIDASKQRIFVISA